MNRILLFLLGFLSFTFYNSTSFGQVQAYSFNVSSSTFTPLVSGINVSAIEFDDAYAEVPIGFNFVLDGTVSDSLVVSSNGWMSLATPSGSYLTNGLSGASSVLRPLIAPLWDDLDGTPGTASYQVTGTAPNRVFTFEWRHWEWNYSSNDSVVSFQVKLYETTNVIKFIYHTENFSSLNNPSASIGLVGVGSGSGSYLSVHDVGMATTYAIDTLEETTIDTVVNNQVFTFTPPPCTVPALASLTNLKYDSVTVNFIANGSGPWYINYGLSGFTQGAPSSYYDTTTTSAFVLGGLVAETDYDFYLQSDCGSNGQSIWYGPFTFTTPPSCPKPVNIVDSNVTTSSLDLGWQSNGSGPWYIYWGPTGFDQASPSVDLDTSAVNYMTFNGLTAGVGYDFYIIEECGTFGTSDTAGPYTVSTNCLAANLPYLENFDSWPLNCWDTTGGTRYWLRYSAPGGGNYARANFWSWSSGNNSLLTSLSINITAPPQIRFDWSHLYSAIYPNDELLVLVEKNNSGIWDTVENLIGPTFTTIGAGNTTPAPAFNQDIIILDSATYMNSTIKVRLLALSGYGPDVFIDNFYVEQVPACVPPTALTALGTSSSSARVSWSPGGGSSWNIEYGPAGFAPGSGTMQASAGTTDTIAGLSPNTTYDFYVQSDCGSSTSAWVGPKSFTTACLSSPMPYYESFDNWPLNCWDTTGGTKYWVQYDPGSGDKYAYADFWGWTSGNNSILTSPLVTISQDAEVRFKWSHLYSTTYPNDALIVRATIAGSGVWDTIALLQGPVNFNDASAGNTSPGNFIEKKVILDPAVYTGQDVRFQLFANSGYGPNLYVNDFYVDNAPTCPPLLNVVATGITDSSATFGWSASSNAGSYEVWYGPQGFYQGTQTLGGIKAFVTANSLQIDTLTGNTCYEFVVRGICSVGDSSDWVGPVSFCTPCSPIVAPYMENFDLLSSGLAGDLGNCWHTLNTSTSSYGFRTNSGSTPSTGTGPTGDATSGNGIYLYTEASNGSPGNPAQLISPVVDVSSLTSAELRFSYHMYGADIDTLHVDANDGSGWQNDLLTIGGQQQTSNSEAWRDTLVDLSGLGNYVQVRFRTKRGASFAGDLSIDDVFFDNPITCPAPKNLGASSITSNSATLTYSSGGSGTFQISYGPAILTPQAGTMVATASSSSYNLSGLNSATNYCFFVREICSVGDTSIWEGPYCFNTLCPANFTAPYYEDFNSWPLNCWDNSGGTSLWQQYSNSSDTSAMANFWGLTSGNTVIMSSPEVILSTDSRIRFSWSHLYSSTYPNDSLYVRVKKVSTGIYDTLLALGGPAFSDPTAGNTSAGGFIQDTIVLDPATYTGNTIVVQFWALSGYGPDLFIDDFHIEANTNCLAPNNISVTPVACDSIMVNWSNGSDSTYLAIAPSGSLPINAKLVQNDTVGYITGTSANSSYDLYVASICGSDTSAIMGPITFNTGNAGYPSVAFTYNINYYDVSFDASGSMGNGNSYSWDFGDGSSGVGDTISHTYASGGSQQVKLTITNACGTTDTTFTVAGISLEEIALGAKVSIFPNPSHDVSNVDVNLDQKGTITIELLSLNGKLISSRTYGSSHQVKDQLDLSHLPNGVYMIRIKTDNGNINRKLIKE